MFLYFYNKHLFFAITNAQLWGKKLWETFLEQKKIDCWGMLVQYNIKMFKKKVY